MTARDQLAAIVLLVNSTQRKLADVGKVIRRAREDAGQTQQQLADRLGVRQGDISRWESGRVVPSGITLGRIAEALRRATAGLGDSQRARERRELQGKSRIVGRKNF